jgi:hypothetical protein
MDRIAMVDGARLKIQQGRVTIFVSVCVSKDDQFLCTKIGAVDGE